MSSESSSMSEERRCLIDQDSTNEDDTGQSLSRDIPMASYKDDKGPSLSLSQKMHPIGDLLPSLVDSEHESYTDNSSLINVLVRN